MITKVTHMFSYKMDFLSTQCELDWNCSITHVLTRPRRPVHWKCAWWNELCSYLALKTQQYNQAISCPSENATKLAPGTINVQWAENASGHFVPSWRRWQQRNNRKWGETGMENDTQQMSPARLVPQTARNQSNLLSAANGVEHGFLD